MRMVYPAFEAVLPTVALGQKGCPLIAFEITVVQPLKTNYKTLMRLFRGEKDSESVLVQRPSLDSFLAALT